MRALLLTAVLAACTPDIVAGSYLCGPEQACPEGQVCNGPDNTCVLPSQAEAFECGPNTEVEPNDAFANAQLVGATSCASLATEIRGCAGNSDGQDWYRIGVPASCTNVSADARIAFPIAFAPLAVSLLDANGVTVAEASGCPAEDTDDGDHHLCLNNAVTPGSSYALRISPTGAGTCDGACARNRYHLTVQLQAR